MTKRSAGTIERRGDRFRVRLSWNGRRLKLGTHATEADAEAVLRATIAKLSRGDAIDESRPTLRTIGPRYLKHRERERGRDIQPDESRWSFHVLKAPFADTPLDDVRQQDVRAWAMDLVDVVSHGSMLLCVRLISGAFAWAIDEELATRNPARGVRLPRERQTREPWTYLRPDEQRALLAVVPEPERWLVLFAMLTGMRLGEIWALRLEDLIVDVEPRVVVRHGTLDGPTKGRKRRTLPLPAPAVESAKAWLEMLPAYAKRNPLGLVFPGRYGAHRGVKPPAQWHGWVREAGITRRVRFHDLRHTCGASLVSGWWGRSWRLEEVREYLGHSTIRQTERYAHLGDTVLRTATSGTSGLPHALISHGETSDMACSARASVFPPFPQVFDQESPHGTDVGQEGPERTMRQLVDGIAFALVSPDYAALERAELAGLGGVA